MSGSGVKMALPKFDKDDDWELHFKKLDAYFVSNNIETTKRVQILLTSVTPPVYKMLQEVCRPDLPKNKTFEALSELIRVNFSQPKKKSIYRERTIFYRAIQGENESVRHWYLRIKALTATCEFGARVNSVLRDKFVTGITNPQVLHRLYEVSPSVSLTDVLKIAINEENPCKKGGWRRLVETTDKTTTRRRKFTKSSLTSGRDVCLIEKSCNIGKIVSGMMKSTFTFTPGDSAAIVLISEKGRNIIGWKMKIMELRREKNLTSVWYPNAWNRRTFSPHETTLR